MSNDINSFESKIKQIDEKIAKLSGDEDRLDKINILSRKKSALMIAQNKIWAKEVASR